MIVSILADTENYRAVYYRTEHLSDTLVITFDVIKSDIANSGFGTDFMIKYGVDTLYVSQRKGTSYQYLSLELFFRIVKDIVASYKAVLLYGHSLGGYAAIYYSQVLNCKVLSICPRCPAHPFNADVAKYQVYKTPFYHIEPIVNVHENEIYLVWDPKDKIDNRYVEFLLTMFKPLKLLATPDLGHNYAPFFLNYNKSLKHFLLSLLQGGALPELVLDLDGHYLYQLSKARYFLSKGELIAAQQHAAQSLKIKHTDEASYILSKISKI